MNTSQSAGKEASSGGEQKTLVTTDLMESQTRDGQT